MAIISKSTQEFIPIKDVRDGVIILKNGSLRMVVMVSSLNFALKGADEQTALLLQFQNFLNSLDFSIQISVQSRKLDIQPYIELLATRLDQIENELIKIQTREYMQFIENLTSSVNIMSKNFFVSIPYTTTAIASSSGVFDKFFRKDKDSENAEQRFEENKVQLEQRALVIEQGLASMGLRSARLGSEELIELLYKSFNPKDKQKPPVSNKK